MADLIGQDDMSDRTCKAAICDRPPYRRGYCRGHYRRWLTTGDAREHVAIGHVYDTTPIDRFRAFWEPDAEGCHIWNGAKDSDGYGHFQFKRRPWKAHRWIFLHVHGWLPPVVMHKCDKPSCVNIACLAPGTIAENNADRDRKGRAADRRGALCPTAKLSEAQVIAIRSAYAAGNCKQRDLALAYGVTQSVISRIVTGRGYANVVATPASRG